MKTGNASKDKCVSFFKYVNKNYFETPSGYINKFKLAERKVYTVSMMHKEFEKELKINKK